MRATVWFAGALLALSQAAGAETMTGKVVGVTDGDTITVLVYRREVKVRLAEIDTPERGQPYATKAKEALSSKVFGQEVRLVEIDTDRYGRSVCHVYLGDRHVNRELVREGHAWVFRKYLRDPSLLEDEAQARGEHLGLWSLPEAERVPPWEWRRARQSHRVPGAGTKARGIAEGTRSRTYTTTR